MRARSSRTARSSSVAAIALGDHGDASGRDARRAGGRDQEIGVDSSAVALTQALAHRSTITLVDLTTPAALIPAARPSSSTDSRVTIATTRAGSVTSISTRASSPSTSTDRTIAAEPVARRQALRAVVRPEPLDLGGRDDPPVRGVALDPDLPLAVPAAKRVEADPERA